MARISELHYSDAHAASTGVAEFIEIALKPGDDPADFTVSLYEASGLVGLELNLQDVLDDINGGGMIATTVTVDADNNEIVYVISSADYNFLLTDPTSGSAGIYEAFALTNVTTNTLIDFYDIGTGASEIVAIDGVVAATDPGNPVASVNLDPVLPPNDVGGSIQFNQPNPNEFVVAVVDPEDSGAACFVSGTEVMTPNGPVAVENLQAGDLVITRDNGAQPIKWCGRQTMPAAGRFAPVSFAAGRYGATRDIAVSPQHRVLLTGWEAELLFGEPEVLVPAKALIDDRFVRQTPRAQVTYHHLLFGRHEILDSHGLWSESYYPVAHKDAGWNDATQTELLAIFPQLALGEFGPLARPTVSVQLGRLLRTI
jgi:hypothetical protein